MNSKEILLERASDIVYHYTSLTNSLSILSSGVFKLSPASGTDVEQQYAPKGYPYFLSLSRSKVGDYHRWVGDSAVMFNLDGRILSNNYPIKPIDYWYSGKTPEKLKKGEWSKIDPLDKRSMWQYSPERSRETEDRLFSKENTVPIDAVTSIHVLITEPDERRSPITRKVLLAAKLRGIRAYLYDNKDSWRFQDISKALETDKFSKFLSGVEPKKYYRRPVRGINDYGRSSLLNWIELIKKTPGQKLSKSADKLRYNITYYGDQSNMLKNDIHNARKPDSDEYDLAVKIINYMNKNNLDINSMVDQIKSKWTKK